MKILTTLAICFSFFCKSCATEQENMPQIYYPIYCHQLVALSCSGDEIEIEDSSLWELNPSDSHKVFLWSLKDPLIFFPERNIFSNYNYKVKNLNTEEFVNLNLKNAPLDTENTLRIASIDYKNNEIELSDESIWKVNLRDTNYKDWLEGDFIIVGLNETSFISKDKFILINASLNSYARVNLK